LKPLDDMFTANSTPIDDYVDALVNDYLAQGQHWALPFARSTPLFYYNKDMFAAAGIADAPKTWDEFAGYAAQLTDSSKSVVAYSHGSAASYLAWIFQPVIWQYGGEYSDAEFNIHINSEQGVAAGTFYQKSIQDGWANSVDAPIDDFNAGLTATTVASTGSLAGVKANATFEFGTAFLPEGPAGFGCCTGGAGLAIPAATEKADAAYAFTTWRTQPENTAWWSQNTGYMPVRKSAVDSMADFFTENPNFKVAVDQLAKTRSQDSARVFIPNGDQIIGGAIEKIIVDLGDVKGALDEVAATLTEEAKPVLEAIQALATPTA
jgi:sn-glycerol 3-phosphate transport system substrate-binding protein